MTATAPAREAAPAAASTPYELIESWSLDQLAADRNPSSPPSPEALDEAVRALAAVHEFLIQPIAGTIEAIATRTSSEWAAGDVSPIPEDERPFDFADIGRLIEFTDNVREEVGWLLGSVRKVALLCHDDLQDLARGYNGEGAATEPGLWNETLRRLHGLDVVA